MNHWRLSVEGDRGGKQPLALSATTGTAAVLRRFQQLLQQMGPGLAKAAKMGVLLHRNYGLVNRVGHMGMY